MAESGSSLSTFFAKKGKKKPRNAVVTPDDFLMAADRGNGHYDGTEGDNYATSGGGGSNNDGGASTRYVPDDDDWKEVEEKGEVNLDGLRIQAINLTDRGLDDDDDKDSQGSGNRGDAGPESVWLKKPKKERRSSDDDEDGAASGSEEEREERADRAKNGEEEVSATEMAAAAVDNQQQQQENAEHPQGSASKPAYVPPHQRKMMATSSVAPKAAVAVATAPAATVGADGTVKLEPVKMGAVGGWRARQQAKRNIDVNSAEEFPTLGTPSKGKGKQDENDDDFIQVTRRR